MNKNFGIGFLVLAFGFSSVNVSLATQIDIPPIIVQPYDSQGMNQQMIELDQVSQEQELAIKGLINENQKLNDAVLAQKHNAMLEKTNKAMANSQSVSKYDELITLTEDADAMTSVGQTLDLKKDALEGKYKILSDLKNEIWALNEKLKAQGGNGNSNNIIIHQQGDKIRILTQRLGEMDQRIANYDNLLAQKDQQIAQLKNNLSRIQSEAKAKDEMINEKNDQVGLLKSELGGKLTQDNNENNQGQNDDAIIKQQENQITALKAQAQELTSKVNFMNSQADQMVKALEAEQFKYQTAAYTREHAQAMAVRNRKHSKEKFMNSQADQMAMASEQSKNQSTQYARAQAQIVALANQIRSKEDIMKSQADQMAMASEQSKNQSAAYATAQTQVMALRNQIQAQALDLKAKNESIRWLTQVLAVTKNKSKYYQLTSQQEQLALEQVQGEVRSIKDDFARHFKDYDHFENAVVSLKSQVDRLGVQLFQKQEQVDALKSELEDKTNQEKIQGQQEAQIKQDLMDQKKQMGQLGLQLSQKQAEVGVLRSELLNTVRQEKDQGQQEAQVQQDLKTQLQDKENQIVQMKADILAILQDRANKEIYLHNASVQLDDRVKLAQQLINLQQQETALLEEKSKLVQLQNTTFDQHVLDLQNKIKQLLDNHQIQAADWQIQMEALKNDLDQKNQQVDLLKTKLENKINEEKDQAALEDRSQDLKIQLQDKEDQIATMKVQIQAGQQANEEVDTLKQQLLTQQDTAEQLRQQLDSKIAQSDQLSLMIGEYQKKLESKDNVYNQQLGEVLLSKKYQAQMEMQIAALNSQLQEKEAQVIKIKKDMYDLQELNSAKDRESRAQDLSLSIMQQKMREEKINEYQVQINGLQASNDRQEQDVTDLKAALEQARQQLKSIPNSDELIFLRSGYKKATAELQQKSGLLFQTKANADEYEKEFKEQSQEFQSLKGQLQDAQEQIQRKDEDLKYKDMEITRDKALSRATEKELQDQVRVLTKQLYAGENKFGGQTHEGKVGALQARLNKANLQITDLQAQLNQLRSLSKSDPLEEKLTQALGKIDEQGHVINVLTQQLQDCGKSVDLTKDIDK